MLQMIRRSRLAAGTVLLGSALSAIAVVAVPAHAAAPAQTSTIKGLAWNDADGDGIREPGEKPLAGTRVLLVDNSGTQPKYRQARTNDNGRYAFTDLPGATRDHTYALFMGAPDTTWAWTGRRQGEDTDDNSDVVPFDKWADVPSQYRSYFVAKSAVAYYLAADVQAGKQLTIDGGLVKRDAGPPTTGGGSSPQPDPSPSTANPGEGEDDGNLPTTGVSLPWLVAAGTGLLGGGALLLALLARRRPTRA